MVFIVMSISAINSVQNRTNIPRENIGVNTQKTNMQMAKSSRHIENYLSYVSSINKSMISFKGSFDNNAQKLFWVLSGTNAIYEDDYTKDHYFNGGNTGWKKWVYAPASELLQRTPVQAIQSLCTMTKPVNSFPKIPSNISTPNYGNNWGRHANYIEINPRTIAKHEYDRVSEGILGVIKLLPAIPPSANNFANCVVLSQLYPALWGESYTGDGTSLYTMNLNTGISKNVSSPWLERNSVRVSDEDQIRAFNDLAHMRGLKTGFRMLLSEGQMKVDGRDFNWDTDEDVFVGECVKAINLGFDAVYFDSAKHIGGYEPEHYCGVGRLPSYEQMQRINYKIRDWSGRNDISIVGEKCDRHPRFEEMGFNAGTDKVNAEDRSGIERESREQSRNQNYGSGPEVSNDNDDAWYDFETRLSRMGNCLFGYNSPEEKLPTFMQMNDLFPLTPYTTTHQEMLESKSRGNSCPDEHIANVFDSSDNAKHYQRIVNNIFADAIYK